MPSRMVFTTTERERLGDFSSPAARLAKLLRALLEVLSTGAADALSA